MYSKNEIISIFKYTNECMKLLPWQVQRQFSFNALCTYIKPISMLGSSVTMIGAGPGPYHTYSPIIISWNKMEKVLHLTRKQWVSQSYCKKSNQLVIVSFLFFLSFFLCRADPHEKGLYSVSSISVVFFWMLINGSIETVAKPKGWKI